ncbi:MAG: His/Gly/Thr/Pro-type tRNA ligase C-terminal domain-containing protein [Candidatus Paceibacterota bacterium]
MTQTHTTLHDPVLAEKKPTHFKYKGPKKFATAINIARHYGFHLIEPVKPKRTLSRRAREVQGKTKRDKSGEWYIHLEDKFAELNKYINDMEGWPQPPLVCHTLHPRRKVGKVRLSMFGCDKTISEGLIIATALSILGELGHKNLGVDINCVGNRETKQKWAEQFKEHTKKNLNDMRPTCQTTFKQDPFQITACEDDICRDIAARAPKTLSYLHKADRQHLKDICEYLEAIEAPYRINNSLVGSYHHDSHTIFHIRTFNDEGESSGPVLARGERHHSVAGHIGYQRSIPTVSASIDVPGGRRESYKSVDEKEVERPKVYYIHLGNRAKKQSLPVLEKLRQEGITVLQSLTRDKIRDQIIAAEQMNIPHAIIMGEKEAQENSVIVRDMLSRSQDTFPIDQVISYIKTL